MLRVNFGCGRQRRKGYVNVDINPLLDPDMVWDLEQFPYPFLDNSVDEVIMEHVLEHINDLKGCLREVYRILRPGGVFRFRTPHFSYGWAHPFHQRGFGYGFLKVIDRRGGCEVPEVHFIEVKKARLNYSGWDNHDWQSMVMQTVRVPINFFANLHPGFCERVWCYWVGGFEEVQYEWKAKK